jgi:hypothetical protein
MQPCKPHLTAEVALDAVTEALHAWRWLLGAAWSPLLVSAAGDVFLINSAGSIARLDTGVGTLEIVADTRDDFEAALNNPAVIADWFLQPVVDELRAHGKRLSCGQCYGFTILPIFKEGDYGAGNRYCLDAMEYLRFTGDIHQKLHNVPDAERVHIQTTD